MFQVSSSQSPGVKGEEFADRGDYVISTLSFALRHFLVGCLQVHEPITRLFTRATDSFPRPDRLQGQASIHRSSSQGKSAISPAFTLRQGRKSTPFPSIYSPFCLFRYSFDSIRQDRLGGDPHCKRALDTHWSKSTDYYAWADTYTTGVTYEVSITKFKNVNYGYITVTSARL